ncbi:MATE family efflux transporter [Fusibacter paucivorans]|uniref:Multidrug export protein MepA n=1 Tax=Fusibacter paucivorans TaxID=76009 RepID=A0ABS5PQQ8_9FIRM|nr:MATE family efflux transporter [Fusibacter paucivorans]MBS7526382.1 MATE family efflux transporter [Fusibacter paucivorans]
MNNEHIKLEMMQSERIPIILLKLGIPTMIGMIISALYSVVDAYFVGGLGSSQMAAVAVVFPIVQIIVGLGMTFGSGAASYISRLLGESNRDQANRTASTALFSSMLVGTVCIVLALCLLDNILVLLGATATILPFAKEYAVIYIAGAILNIVNVTMNNVITAEGRAKLTMTSMLAGGILNVVLDPIFIYRFDFGIRGAAMATVISQAATVCLYLWFILGKRGYLHFSIRLVTLDQKIFKEIFKVGLPILLFQILASLSMGLSNMTASAYGDSAVAAIGAVTRIMTLGTYVVFGFMKGFQPVAGFNYGSKRYDRLNEATKVSLRWTTIFCTIVGIIMIVIPTPIISLFSESDTVFIDIGTKALRANGFIFPFYGLQMVYMALFLAIGKGKEGGLLSVSRQGIFFVPIILVCSRLFGLDGIIWAQPLADIFTVLFTAYFAYGYYKDIDTMKGSKVISQLEGQGEWINDHN